MIKRGKGRPTIITKRVRERIIADLDRGMTQEDAAAKYGISRSSVTRVIGSVYGSIGDEGPSEEELNRMIAERYPTMPREPKRDWPNKSEPVAVYRGRGVKSTPRVRSGGGG